MGDDNDFTFCQVGSSVNQEHHTSLPDIGGVTIKDELLKSQPGNNQVESSTQKEHPLESSELKSYGTVGSLSFSVVDMSSAKKTDLPQQSEFPDSKDSVNGSEDRKISTKKPIVPTKVPFEKGYSQMDWLKLTQTHPDLAGLKGESCKRLISMDEVKKHRTEGSVWTVLKGHVYNITPYMNFHPGGVDMLKKAAGKDCTSLFNKYHAWVNSEFLLEKCLVGILDVSK